METKVTSLTLVVTDVPWVTHLLVENNGWVTGFRKGPRMKETSGYALYLSDVGRDFVDKLIEVGVVQFFFYPPKHPLSPFSMSLESSEIEDEDAFRAKVKEILEEFEARLTKLEHNPGTHTPAGVWQDGSEGKGVGWSI